MLRRMTAIVMLVGALAPHVSACGPADAASPRSSRRCSRSAWSRPGSCGASDRAAPAAVAWLAAGARSSRCVVADRGAGLGVDGRATSSGSTWRSGRRSARCWRRRDRPARRRWSGCSTPARSASLGSFSYSLYLIHAPIVVVLYTRLVAPRVCPRRAPVPDHAAGGGAAGCPGRAPVRRCLRAAVHPQPDLARAEGGHPGPGRRVATPPRRGAGRGLRGGGSAAAGGQADELAPAVPDGTLLPAQVHPVHGRPGPDPLLTGEVGRP